MSYDKPESIHTITVLDCDPCTPESDHWFDPHMPCWICNHDPHSHRDQLLWNDECEVYFHYDCLVTRELHQLNQPETIGDLMQRILDSL